jgi:catechol 2,3-dioxygenase-like lactoylglutathione lyase family enzyme
VSSDALRPARRFLHVCYNGDEKAAATGMFVEALDMRHAWTAPTGRQSASILGVEDDVVSGADFVFDARGPRTSPAIEVQEWIDPAPVRPPYEDPTAVGVQALGFAVPDVDDVRRRLQALGSVPVGSGPSPLASPWVTVRDPGGVTFDLVGDASVPTGESRMRHVRITVTELATSIPWYERVGFELVGRRPFDHGAFVGHDDPVEAEAARLRLPDEPYEVILVEWRTPRSHGRHYAEPYHAGIYRAALGVDDTRAAYAAMTADGVEFTHPPISVELTGTPVPDMWICFLKDPDGVQYELVERPRSAFRP